MSGFCPETGFITDISRFCEQITPETELVFFCNPNNPTGHAVPKHQMLQIAERCQKTGTWLILDECFCDLLENPEAFSVVSETERFSRLFILRAFTKTYAMAGLRLGYGICADRDLLRTLFTDASPGASSVPAQEAGCAALGEAAYLNEARGILKTGRTYLSRELRRLGFVVYDSDINFILFYDQEESRPLFLYEACLKIGCPAAGLQQFHRTFPWILSCLRQQAGGKPGADPYTGADPGRDKKKVKTKEKADHEFISDYPRR